MVADALVRHIAFVIAIACNFWSFLFIVLEVELKGDVRSTVWRSDKGEMMSYAKHVKRVSNVVSRVFPAFN